MFNFQEIIFSPPESSLLYTGHYDPLLVSISIVVAMFASYASLLVSQQVPLATTKQGRRAWLVAGGICLGVGIWAMHFVGMLAFSLPCTARYNPLLTIFSMIPGILASTLAIRIISRRVLSHKQLISGGLLLGVGIGAMHYTGMAAMRLNGLIRYDGRLFLLSIVVAMVLATLALWVKFRLYSAHSRWNAISTIACAVVMGFAVSGMHYTAMASAYFIRGGDANLTASGISPSFLATIVLAATCLIIVVTIVATYIDKKHVLSLWRSYKLLGLLILGWGSIAWLSAEYYYGYLADNAYQLETREATNQAEDIARNISESIAVLKSVSMVYSRDEDIHQALHRFGVDAKTSTVEYEIRKYRWSHDKMFAGLNHSLDLAATDFKADVVWIMNAAGDCIASSNAGRADSFVGSNYADREYFKQALAGQGGHQYAVGRTSNIPGLFYSYPVFEKGAFLGAVVVKRNITRFSQWVKQGNAFIADINGVVVLSANKGFEFHYLPNAPAANFAPDKVRVLYKQNELEPLEISPWGDAKFPDAWRIHSGEVKLPVVLGVKNLQDDAISIYALRPLTELLRFDSEKFGLFLLLAFTGGMLIIAASAVALYLRQSRLTEADLRVSATAFESQQGMLISDAENVILRVNKAFTDITGYAAGDVIGQTPHMLSSGRHDAAFYAAMWRSIEKNGAWQGEIWNRRKNGEVYPEWLSISAVKNASGSVSHFVAAIADITHRKAAEEEIKHLAFFDPLTQLPNRRLLMDRLHQSQALSSRSGRNGALIFIDLDNFKDLNDTLGHDKGDQLLQQAAKRFSDCVRDGDTVARLGGDEFVVMLEGLNENYQEAATQAKFVGQKILSVLNQPYKLAEIEYQSSSSIGITLFGNAVVSVDDLLKQADLAMYQAKAAGRNTLRFFDPDMQAVVMARASLESDLRIGVMSNQFLLYYQPQVDGNGHITGAEALIRWQHPRRGMVSPAEFIPAAEESGLILPLGNWVLETACAQLAEWATRPETAHLTLAVNISARQFHQPSFVDHVLVLLEGTGADPQKLKLELTESMLLNDVEDIITKMLALRSRGVVFSLDDFGTGYSSLSYLKRLPLDQLKIDQSFVRDMLSDPNDAAIACTIVTLGQSLGLTVIAEGVETVEQQVFLAEHGCLACQGYLFGRPLPLLAFEKLLLR
jgi:diguanylate cyclase (GGDEF)-like protein/PAS domain S-box-containing protein